MTSDQKQLRPRLALFDLDHTLCVAEQKDYPNARPREDMIERLCASSGLFRVRKRGSWRAFLSSQFAS